MKGVEKCILIPIEKYERLLQEKQELQNRSYNEEDFENYDELDTAILDILKNKDVLQEEKVKAYLEILEKYKNTDMEKEEEKDNIFNDVNEDNDMKLPTKDSLELNNDDTEDIELKKNNSNDKDIKLKKNNSNANDSLTPPGVNDLDQIGKGYYDGPPGIKDINTLGKIKKKKKYKITKWERF